MRGHDTTVTPPLHVAESGGLVGSVVSDRYMDQLASMKPFEEQQGKKFSLGAMLVERKGTDAEGNERGVLVTTQVDGPGTLGIEFRVTQLNKYY